MATALDIRHRSLAEFLAWEERQADRYERVSGVVWMMTGGTVDHSRITLNVANALRQRLQEGRCEVFVNDIRVVSRSPRELPMAAGGA